MSAKKIHRVPILVALAAVVVAAIALDNGESSSQASAIPAGATAADPAVPPKDSLSTSWYCAEGTSAPDGRADETILVASVADTKTDATITVMPGGLTAPVSRTVHLEPREEARVRVADVVSTAEPAVVVEVVGGQAVVAHELAANGDIATEPCARGASTDWYFANGTTLKGAQQYIVLFNPFGDDAIVDLTFVTDDGVQQPDNLQALSVPRRSRITIPVNDAVPRQREVAVHIHARSGRVVAERSQLFDGTASDGEVERQGIGLSLGAPSPRREWYFPYGTTADGASGQIGVANFGSTSATVEVNVMLDGGETLGPQSVDVSARGVTTVDVGNRVPAGTQYAVTVIARSTEAHSGPVVAEVLESWPSSSASTGVATTLGSTRLAKRWVIALPSANVEGVITVVNPGTEPLTASLLVYDAGDTTGPPSEPERSVVANHFAVFDLVELGAGGDHVLVVTSDRPVAVGVTYTGPSGAAITAAIPDFANGAR
jgi:Family of unknown function (DUF5719)